MVLEKVWILQESGEDSTGLGADLAGDLANPSEARGEELGKEEPKGADAVKERDAQRPGPFWVGRRGLANKYEDAVRPTSALRVHRPSRLRDSPSLTEGGNRHPLHKELRRNLRAL